MKIYFISDTHFFHLFNRPFSSPEEMNQTIIRNWNNKVKPEDTVYFLGDWGLTKSSLTPNAPDRHVLQALVKQLNGTIIFIRGSHDCFSKDTKLLTAQGYKYYSDLKLGELIPTINKDKNRIEYQPIQKITKTFVKEGYGYKTKTAEGLFSNKHDLIILQNNTQNSNTERKWIKAKPPEVWHNKSRILVPSSFISGNNEYPISDNYLKLLGWIYTDGSIIKVSRSPKYRGIIIWQSKLQGRKSIKKLLKQLHIKYKETKIKKKILPIFILNREIKTSLVAYKYTINAQPSRKILQLLAIDAKYDIPLWLNSLSDRQGLILIKSMLEGDGHIQNSGTYVLWGIKSFLEKILGFCVTHGLDAILVKQRTRKNSYYLSIHVKRKHKQYFAHYGIKYIYPQKRYIKHYNNIMWDVTVPNHIIFAELNGKPLITGNSNNGIKTAIQSLVILLGGYQINLVHDPKHAKENYLFNFCGHWHGTKGTFIKQGKTIVVDLSVENWNYTPVSINEILSEYSKWLKGQK
jgi:calcineurin-like phosphoesterase family protein